ncbi:MAG: Na+ dependent nucleoside transporter [Bacteroidetes bacterium]|nr:MAG: Na+ dependent nucleoside transporter [Bacteroidota bacterium]PIE88466.1 MAG: Na+ dependent nucleoside transporter [Bacteroidota bacterium]
MKKVLGLLLLFSLFIIGTGMVVGTKGSLKSDNFVEDALLGNPLLTDSSVEVSEVVEEVPEVQQEALFRGAMANMLMSLESSGGIKFMNILRGMLGLAVLLFLCYLMSTNRKAIRWGIVARGLLLQVLLALGVLYVPFIQSFFEIVGRLFVYVLQAAESGAIFLLGDLINNDSLGYIFAFKILPTVVFFSAISSLLFYWGVIQLVVRGLAWVMIRAMRLSGTESLSLAGNIFLGQTESPLLVKAYLDKLTHSELFLVMVGGMATMAGGVLAAYIGFLGGNDPVAQMIFAKHLLAASVMAAPGAVVAAKILVPQTESIDQDATINTEKIGANALDAFSNGTTDGMKLAVNIAAMLLTYIAAIALVNIVLGKIGAWTHLNDWVVANTGYKAFSLQFILGYALSPLMWLLGVPSSDIAYLGQLLGEKTILNEFVGYGSLSAMINQGLLQPKSIIMATYLLCGFANFSSVGIQIGGIGALAPNQKVNLSKFGMRALFAGAISALISATLIGMLLG